MSTLHCQFVGPAYFHPLLGEEQIGTENKGWIEMDARTGDMEGTEEPDENAWYLITKLARAGGEQQPHHSDCVKTKERESNSNSNANTSDADATTVQLVAMKGKENQADLRLKTRKEKGSSIRSAAKEGMNKGLNSV